MIWLLVGYMWLFIHRPFEVWPWLGDLHVERVYMIAAIGYWLLVAEIRWTSNRINWAVALMAASIVLSTLFSPYIDFSNETVQNWFKLLVFYVLVMSSVRTERDLKILVVAFVAILGLYELHSLHEYFNGRGVYRMGIWRMIGVDAAMSDPNAYAASTTYGLSMLLPVLALSRCRWHKLVIAGLFSLGCLCVLLTGSRTGFAGLTLSLLGAGVASRYRWRLVVLLTIALPISWLSLPENLQNRYLTVIVPSVGPANAQTSADSRQEFFQMAVRIWKEYPVFGVGPTSFAKASRTGMQAHTLYGQTIAELGILGVIAMFAMIGAITVNVGDARRIVRRLESDQQTRFLYYLTLATGIGLLQLLFFGFGGHNVFRYTWLWYGAFGALALRFLAARSADPHPISVRQPLLPDVALNISSCQGTGI